MKIQTWSTTPRSPGSAQQPISPRVWWEMAVVILLVEYMTGPFIHLAVWYTIPIGLAAWYNGWQYSVPLAVAMPLARLSFFLFGLWEHPSETLQAPGVNAMTRTLGLLVVAVVVSHFGRQARSASVQLQGLEEIRRRLPAELAALEHAAEAAPMHLRAQLLTQAADLCVATGEQHRAMTYFGRAIDTYLEDERLDCAEALCQRLIWVAPDVVRTHATLASIALAKQLIQDAEHHLAAYVRAARRAGKQSLAVTRLRAIAETVHGERARQIVEAHLSRLGALAPDRNRIHLSLFESRGSGLDSALSRRWHRLLHVTRMSANDLVKASSTDQMAWQRTGLLASRNAGGLELAGGA